MVVLIVYIQGIFVEGIKKKEKKRNKFFSACERGGDLRIFRYLSTRGFLRKTIYDV